jgi:hypothetical protein
MVDTPLQRLFPKAEVLLSMSSEHLAPILLKLAYEQNQSARSGQPKDTRHEMDPHHSIDERERPSLYRQQLVDGRQKLRFA